MLASSSSSSSSLLLSLSFNIIVIIINIIIDSISYVICLFILFKNYAFILFLFTTNFSLCLLLIHSHTLKTSFCARVLFVHRKIVVIKLFVFFKNGDVCTSISDFGINASVFSFLFFFQLGDFTSSSSLSTLKTSLTKKYLISN